MAMPDTSDTPDAAPTDRSGPAREPVSIAQGYRPGAVGRITELHARYYARAHGFGAFFESQVAQGLAQFVLQMDRPGQGLWLALQAGRIVGSVAIEPSHAPGSPAHLRWFIVEPAVHGQGVGRRLLASALAFCDQQGLAAVALWTFAGLDAARRLYEDVGFELVEEQPGQRWGSPVTEQRFLRQR